MSSTLTITGIQSPLHWEDIPANLAMFGDKIKSISRHTEIVVLPEMFSTGFSMEPGRLAETMEGPTVEWMRKMASERRIILTGSFIAGENAAEGIEKQYFNRLVWMLPNGHYGFYDKRHRFAFGGEDKEYTAGNKRLIASVKGWRINLQVCYDLRFPVWARQRIQTEGPEYDVLIYVANWPERRIHAWKTLLQARAIENQCYVVGVNRVGIDGNNISYSGESMVIDPLGEVLYLSTGEDIFTLTLDNDHLHNVREKFPFWRDADGFQLWREDS